MSEHQGSQSTGARPGGCFLEFVRAFAALFVLESMIYHVAERKADLALSQGLLAIAAFALLRPRVGWSAFLATFYVLGFYIAEIEEYPHDPEFFARTAVEEPLKLGVWWCFVAVMALRWVLGHGREQQRRIRLAAGYIVPPLEPKPVVENPNEVLLRPSTFSAEESLLRVPKLQKGDPSILLHIEEEAAMAAPAEAVHSPAPVTAAPKPSSFDPLRLAAQAGCLALLIFGMVRVWTHFTFEVPRAALVEAVKANDTKLVEVRLDRMSVNTATDDGKTLLSVAAESRAKEVADLFLRLGADVRRKDIYGRAPLAYAAYSNASDIAQRLIQAGAPADEPDDQGVTPLMIAVRPGGVASIDLLLASGAKVNRKDNNGETALMRAASLNLPGIMKKLLKAGADPRITSNSLDTALHAAALMSPAGVKLLIAAGADVNAHCQLGFTPLIYAAASGDADGVDALLTAGADPLAKSVEGMTPLLMLTPSTGERTQMVTRIVRALIQRKVDLNAKDRQGETVLSNLVWGPDPPYDAIQLLLAAGANPNATNPSGETPLMRASAYGTTATIKLLLSYHADLNARSDEQKTALMYAARAEKEEAVRALIHAGAQVNARDSLGRTALDYAVEFQYSEECKATARRLREAGGLSFSYSGTP